MPRPKLFRDPVHGQIRFEPVSLEKKAPSGAGAKKSWVLQKLIDTKEFQRLRHIRQNGLANFVFHGAEHSRFSHSMGVAYLAAEMYQRILRNMGETTDDSAQLCTAVAALLHDVGHGPFSHTIEEILKGAEIPFNHEQMTLRFIEENDSAINGILRAIDAELPNHIAAYFDETRRKDDRWIYRLVSSQLDADRLDYLLRDARGAGLTGHSYDLPRLLDMLHHSEGKRIAVHQRGFETVEGYLVALDQMYRAVYFHHTNRGASILIASILHRAHHLASNGATDVFPGDPSGLHPLASLFKEGQKVNLRQYARLGEHQVWALVEAWQFHNDKTLSDLSRRIMARQIFKTWDLDLNRLESWEDYETMNKALEVARKLVKSDLGVTEDEVNYYVHRDEPSRTSYIRYDWKPEAADRSIWIIDETGAAQPIEAADHSEIVLALKKKRYFPRIAFPAEIRQKLYKTLRED